MASFTKIHQFVKDLVDGVHNFDSDTFKVCLTNTAVTVATDAVFGDLTEISAGSGYTAGGSESTNVATSVTTGTAKVVGDDVVFTASGAVGPFQYAVLYNDTPSSPADPLVGTWDYGSAITLASAETFTVDFDASAGILTLA